MARELKDPSRGTWQKQAGHPDFGDARTELHHIVDGTGNARSGRTPTEFEQIGLILGTRRNNERRENSYLPPEERIFENFTKHVFANILLGHVT